jgi:hypothetical protein
VGDKCSFTLAEQHFRLEHETVAHHANVFPVGQDTPQPAKEFRAELVELLYPLRQRHVQPAAQIGNLRAAFGVLPLGCIQRIVQHADLAAQRGDLLVEQLDPCQRVG